MKEVVFVVMVVWKVVKGIVEEMVKVVIMVVVYGCGWGSNFVIVAGIESLA